VNVQDSNGWTALMKAAYWNQVAVIKVLADRGADLNLRNVKGNTALAIAKARSYSAEAYALLKSLGAKE
jgi:methionyl-tRNA formyltransferase